MGNQVLTVVFTDIAGFHKKAASRTRNEMLGLLERHEALLLPVVEHFGGRVVKTLGDAFLLIFDDPTAAVTAGVMMQERLREHNEYRPEEEWIQIRVAIHTGPVDVLEHAGDHIDVYGDAVHIASRIEALTSPGEVFFTQATYGEMDQEQVPTSEVGEFKLKGIGNTVRVYKVIQDQRHDRYRRLVDSVDLPELEPADSTMRGVFSKSLLYGLEQNRMLGSRMQGWGVGPWILATAVLLVLSGGGFLVAKSGARMRAKSKAAKLIEADQPQQALAILIPLRDQDPTDIRVLETIGTAVQRDVELLIEQSAFDEAQRRVDDHRKAMPHLSVYDDLEKRIGVAHAKTKVNLKDRLTFIHELVERFPRDLEATHLLVQTCAEIGEGYYLLGLLHTRVLLEEDKERYRRDPAVLDVTRGFVLRVTYVGGKPEHRQAHALIVEHLYDTVREFLVEYIYSDEPTLWVPRWNAYLLMERKGDAELDEFRFFTNALLVGDWKVWDGARIAKYFSDQRAQHTDEHIRSRVDFEVKDLKLLRRRVHEAEIVLFSELFGPLFAEELTECATADNAIQYRLNCYTALVQSGADVPVGVERSHHLRNLEYGRTRLTSQWLHEAIAYFGQIEDPELAADAIPLLEEVEVALKNELQRHTRDGAFMMVREVEKQRGNVRAALAHLRG